MKLLPILLIGLTPQAVLHGLPSQEPAESTLQVSNLAAHALVLSTLNAPSLLLQESGEAAPKAQAGNAGSQDPAPTPTTPETPEEPAAPDTEPAAQEPAPELLDVREVDPREFASGIPVPGAQEPAAEPVEPEEIAEPLEAASQMPLDGPETTEGMYRIEDEIEEEVQYEEVAGTSHAPIGVPLTRQVATGQWALVLRGSHNQYDGLRDSRDNLSSGDAFARGYSVAPKERTDQRLEVEALYGLNERWDLYAILPYSMRDLDYDQNPGASASVDTTGLGDLQLGGVFRSYDVDGTRLSYLVGVSIPTGEIDERGDYAGVADAKLPYDLQHGTGTFDLHPGVLFETQSGDVLLGARAAGRIHIETENDEGYFWSNSMRFDVWAGTELADDLTGTVRLQADWWGDLHNFDPELDPTQSPGEDSLRQGGSRVNLYGGLSWDLNDDRAQQIALEVGVPVEEWLDGPQLSQELSLLLGWRASF